MNLAFQHVCSCTHTDMHFCDFRIISKEQGFKLIMVVSALVTGRRLRKVSHTTTHHNKSTSGAVPCSTVSISEVIQRTKCGFIDLSIISSISCSYLKNALQWKKIWQRKEYIYRKDTGLFPHLLCQLIGLKETTLFWQSELTCQHFKIGLLAVHTKASYIAKWFTQISLSKYCDFILGNIKNLDTRDIHFLSCLIQTQRKGDVNTEIIPACTVSKEASQRENVMEIFEKLSGVFNIGCVTIHT